MLYGAPLEKDQRPVVRKGRAGAHSGSRSRSSSVFHEAVRHGHDPTVSKLCGQTGTQESCRLASSRGCPTSWDETAGAACAHQLRRIMFTRSCGLSFRWARGTAAS